MSPRAATQREDWRPTSSREFLRRRAALLARLRAYFAAREVLEVETPILSAYAVSDPQIESLSTRIAGMPAEHYLSTSPEYPMKRLLAAGSGDIYQVCKVFRDEEHGRWHNPEFTMVEWYRLGFDEHALMDEVEDLIACLLAACREFAPPRPPPESLERPARAERLTYAQALRRHAAVDAHRDDDATLARAAQQHGVQCSSALDRDGRLDLLMGLVVGPRLGHGRPCFVCDYPASQAALARLKPGTPPVAARFECYLDGVELANGFHELIDAGEQRRRFAADLAARRVRGQRERPVDVRLLAALEAGVPECAGVALGFDRLVAVALGAAGLSEVMAFSIDGA